MESSTAHKPALITFPPSLDSELARFLLEHYRIDYEEQPQAFIFCFFVTLWHGGTVIFPLLYNKSLKLVGPQAIADYFDQRCAPELCLWPQAADEKQQVTSDWTLFNQTLAFATAVFAYYYLLPYRQLMILPLSRGTPTFEQKSVQRAYPLFAGALQDSLAPDGSEGAAKPGPDPHQYLARWTLGSPMVRKFLVAIG